MAHARSGETQEAASSGSDPEVEDVRRLLTAASYAEAEARARTLVAARERIAPRTLKVARALDVLVQALVEGGKSADSSALESASRALELKQSLLGPEDRDVAVSLSNLALVLRRRGKLDEAEQAYERALAIRERADGPMHVEVSRILSSLGAVANQAGDFSRGRQLGERALAIAERADPPQPLLVATAANNLAISLFELNEHDASRRRLELALHSYEGTLGAGHPEVAKTLSNLANVVSNAGDLVEARGMYERALAIQEQRQGPHHPDVALSLNNLAEVLLLIGDHAGSRALFERSLQILERAYGPTHNRVAMALGNLAEARSAMGHYDAALPLYERALTVREGAVGSDHPSLVYTLTGRGRVKQQLGDREGARASYERALSIGERAFGPGHPIVAMTLHASGDLLASTGKHAAAAEQLSRSLQIRRTLLGDDHPLVAETRLSLASVARASGDPAALDHALEAERVARAHLQVTVQGLPERQALAYSEQRVSGRDVALSLLAGTAGSDPGAIRRVWDAVVRSRAIVLEEMASRHRLIAGATDPAIAALATDLAAIRQRLAGLLVRSAADPASRERVLETLQSREQAEQRLADRSLDFRRQQTRARAGLADAIEALPARSALVAYVRYEGDRAARTVPSSGGNRSRATETDERRESNYFAFVVRSGSAPAAIHLGPARHVEQAVRAWRDGILSESHAGLSTARTERVHRRAGERLRRLVWDPLLRSLEDVEQVFIVPDGPLHLVNWAALPGRQGRYLVEDDRLLHYLSTERDLVQPDAAAGNGLLIVDSPAYDRRASAEPSRKRLPRGVADRSTCADLASLRFDALPDTRLEGDAIASLWSKAGMVDPANGSTTSTLVRLSGARATEATVTENVAGRRVVHFATHGFFLGPWCGTQERMQRGDRSGWGPSGLLLAGLALSGANNRRGHPNGRDDGVLISEEIAALDLRGVEWAVLSACDTGVGMVRAGEGLFGLRRVFEIAGAATIIVSLWPVDDEMTRHWMTAAYRSRFIERQPTAVAVRRASVDLLASLRARGQSTHPARWAAFIAAGAW